MKTYILMMPVEGNDRVDVEGLSEAVFEDLSQARNTINGNEARLIPLYDFMEACNDQEIDLEEYWVSHIYIKGATA